MSFEDKVKAASKAENKRRTPERLLALSGQHMEGFIMSCMRGSYTAQSIAITKNDRDYSSFGTITTVFKPSVIFDGKSSIPKSDNDSILMSGDYYSARTPSLRVILDSKPYKDFMKKILDSENGDDYCYHRFQYQRKDVDFHRIFNDFMSSSTAKYIFMAEQGIEVKMAYKRKPISRDSIIPYVKENLSIKEYAKLLVKANTGDKDALTEWQDIYRKAELGDLDRFEGKGERLVQRVKERVENTLTYSSDTEIRKELAVIQSIRSREMVLDKGVNKKRFAAAFKKAGGQAAYVTWVRRELGGMVDRTFSLTQDGRKINDYNQVDRYMKRNRGQGQENTRCLSVGELLSQGTERLYSLGEVIERSSKINTDRDATKSKELDDALMSFKLGVSMNVRDFEQYENDKICGELAIADRNGSNLDRIMSVAKIENTPEAKAKLAELVGRLKDAYDAADKSVPYFELVKFDPIKMSPENVECILVKKEYKECVEQCLADHGIRGITVKGYNPEIEGAQLRGVGASEDIISLNKKLSRTNKLTNKAA
ncbi:hypothetical protein VCHA53O466_50451 [Vibrio chagasii]|nr:hypothetical protein VCHA53O466_50451 [Vibrio chagasii]